MAGTIGYRYVEGLAWTDALFAATMLVSGMGLVTTPQTAAGKLFASLFALYSGVVFVAVSGIVLAPIVHRLLHRFHLGR